MRIYSIFLFLVFLSSCGGKEFVKNPVDILIRDMTDSESFSILLYDMDVQGNFSKDYFHKYRIIETKNGETDELTTDWIEVPKDHFERNVDNMGMEIAAKSPDGEVSKVASPPGYSSYVGNEKYGTWRQRDGYSFWEFYGQYAFLSTMFNMATFPVRRSYYNDYYGNYRGRRPYYGPSTGGTTMYGTGSTYANRHKSNTSWSRNPRSNSFRQRVNNSVSRSRSGSRYSSSSSMRSRGGGFGK